MGGNREVVLPSEMICRKRPELDLEGAKGWEAGLF